MATNTHPLRCANLYLLYRYIILFLAVIACIVAPRSEAKEIQDVLAELETYASEQMTAEKVPGMAYAIVKDDQVIYAYNEKRFAYYDGCMSSEIMRFQLDPDHFSCFVHDRLALVPFAKLEAGGEGRKSKFQRKTLELWKNFML